MDSRTHRLAQNISEFLQDPPQGIESPILEGLESIHDVLLTPMEGEPTPGQESVAEATGGGFAPRSRDKVQPRATSAGGGY